MVNYIVFFTPEYSPTGYVNLLPLPAVKGVYSRRTSKSATLDGGAYITDLGYSASDRDFELTFDNDTRDNAAQLLVLVDLAKNYNTLRMSSDEGLFAGVVDSITLAKRATVRFRVSSKIQ